MKEAKECTLELERAKEKYDEILHLIGIGPDRYDSAPVEFPGLKQVRDREQELRRQYIEDGGHSMAGWNFVYHTPEEIAEAMEGALSYRRVVDERKEALKEAKAKEFYEGKHFESLEELSEYTEELIEKSNQVEAARQALLDAEETLESFEDALRSVIPPGGSVYYDAKDGTRYLVKHRGDGNGHQGSSKPTITFYISEPARAAR